MTRTADKAKRAARRFIRDFREGRPITRTRLARLSRLDPQAGALAENLLTMLTKVGP